MSEKTEIQHYNEEFAAALEMLNEQQKSAVDTIEGPVLVIAGPGTGKTHILTARIGKILLETDAQPHNILCLTFTDAGVQAMRARLLQFIGPEAHRVHIFTFHSFCNGVIQDNLELFGRHDLEPVSELEKVEIIQEILDELPVAHSLRQGRGGDLYFYATHLSDLFQRMKAEDWSADFLNRQIDKYLADLPLRDDFIYKKNTKNAQKGELKQAKFDQEKERMDKLRAGLQLFEVYVKKMRQRRRYDYEDMILWVVKAFDENEALLRTYQEQYLYFLIDEYQDTNGAQNEILQHLIRYWQNPNIFIVGDDDQSIYEFQGARLKNLTDFYTQYENDLALVVLQNNYRSTQPILDSARQLINHNQKRIVNSLSELGIDKFLQAKHPDFRHSEVLPSIIEYPNKVHEEADIVQQIEDLQTKGIALEEIAVIYAKHRQANDLISLLEKKNIPYKTKRKVNILDLPLIRRLRMMLEYFYAENMLPFSGEDLLFKILHFDFLALDLDDLAKLSLFQAKQKYEQRKTWRELIADEHILKKSQLKNAKQLVQIAQLFKDLLSGFVNLPVPIFVEQLINRTGLLRLAIDSPEKTQLLQVLHTFVGFVKEEAERNPRLSGRRLLEILRNMDKNRIALQVRKTNNIAAGVNLLTAHGSKGLEFQYVFLLDCIKDTWEGGRGRANFRFKFPDTVTLSGESDVEEARRRLFYVAMTRAREGLQISYAATDTRGKERSRALFVDEVAADKNLEIQQKQVSSAAIDAAQFILLDAPNTVEVKMPDKSELDALLEGFQLSVSAMNQYLRCPVAFFYENVMRVPVVQSEAASYGTAMHNSLQRLFERMMQQEKKQFPSLQEFLTIFKNEMQNLQGYFRPKTYQHNLERGTAYLAGYYKKYISTWSRKVLVEKNISTEVSGVPIKGVIDRLNFTESDKATITDYKTGKHSRKKTQGITKAEPFGGIYFRQLIFYKILYENYRNTTTRITSGTISYLETDSSGNYVEKVLTYQQKDVEKVKSMLISVYQGIMNHEFSDACGEDNCQWCRFLEERKTVLSFADVEIESLDD